MCVLTTAQYNTVQYMSFTSVVMWVGWSWWIWWRWWWWWGWWRWWIFRCGACWYAAQYWWVGSV